MKSLGKVKKTKTESQKENEHPKKLNRQPKISGRNVTVLSDVVVKKPSPVKSHVKFLFKEEIEEEKITNKVEVKKSETEEVADSEGVKEKDFKNNKRVFNNLCYICTRNTTQTNEGIQCTNCSRKFHPTCIRRHNNVPPVTHSYTCKKCCKQLSSI